ncbi:iron-containing redox enzyme family protein [Mumia sp. zg.B53]|uniref:iron-containing redox enzyme family protein n=1 Tax=unclassified Mumia TaxID=2621872 RepID=UPI001C6E1595|nr:MULTISPECIES: iron-containing redox enzyme family protein [unclassified Mumia]MBW9207072.1 iron-containing redox enzyme family protein [Mumia sp. zg.B17]MBW9210592.1 iron-containing redox enzyme family protein [Mumia sp. zg.B21]MBW9215205.1 iron-containing redox enzyme family protein [Mumia sp. zg.B53]MDD9348253.1 iron-containing redox enzyme family protein [Mumia sp.]
MLLPRPRGPLSARLRRLLLDGVEEIDDLETATEGHASSVPPDSVLHDEDLQLSLWMIYELSFRGFDDVDDRWEWAPEIAGLRTVLERPFEQWLRDVTEGWVSRTLAVEGDVADKIFALTDGFDEGPDLSRFIRKEATPDHVRDFLRQRSIYHLKESDPHTFVIPRLTGPAKAHLVELQYDEYGGGRPGFLHHELFAVTLREAGLDDAYGAYIEEADGPTLAATNAMSLLCLHRRLRGVAMGHLAAFEATSSIPCRRIAAGLRRTGFSDDAARYYDEHVEADAVHEQLAAREICGTLVDSGDVSVRDVVFGAAACLVLDRYQSESLMARWDGAHTPDQLEAAR